MRLMTYNIHKGVGTDRRYRLDRIVAVIAAEEPDLICLQEVDHNCRRSRRDNQPALLAERFGATACLYQLNAPHGEGGYGNLLLSRWPLREVRSVALRHRRRTPRGAQMAVVEAPEGPLHLVHVHFGLSERERRWQAVQLLEHPDFLTAAHLPTLIAGDFNDWRNQLGKRCFLPQGFHHATSPPRRFRTFPAFLALAAIDKIYYRGPLQGVATRVVRRRPARRASDHLPVVCDFQLDGAAGVLPAGRAPL
jgi:endonuclease/exonuclease/phosphatase family metal-dependent hydrolase